MRDPDNMRAVAGLGIDLMGFIFWDKSPRNVASLQLSPIGREIARVGVFVDEMPQIIAKRALDYQLDYIQLHGSETSEYIDNLRQTCDAKIIKAISIRETTDVMRWKTYEGHVDMLLFDTKCKCVGGSGEHFDWTVLAQYEGNLPFLLSGGIGPDDAERIKAFHHPQCIGIDLNSKFEDAPGLKNIDKLRIFLKTIRNEQDK